MNLHQLKPIKGATRKRKVVGRGNASGHGTYSTRGCKGMGQRKSGTVRPGFEGGQTPLIMRLPKFKGFKSPTKCIFQVVNVGALNRFEDSTEVTMQTLLDTKLISKKTVPVKILGSGKLEKKLTIKVHEVSSVARKKILAAGGKVL